MTIRGGFVMGNSNVVRGRCYVDTVTPFTDCGDVDLGGVRRNMEFCARRGIRDFLLAGRAGECVDITSQEHDLLLSFGRSLAEELGVNIVEDFEVDLSCHDNFSELSREDVLLKNEEGVSCEIFSIVGNIFPHAITRLVEAKIAKDTKEEMKVYSALTPIFKVIEIERRMIKAKRRFFLQAAVIKLAMSSLGMPAGGLRNPKSTIRRIVVQELRKALLLMSKDNFWLFQPIEEFYEVDVEDRIRCHKIWLSLAD